MVSADVVPVSLRLINDDDPFLDELNQLKIRGHLRASQDRRASNLGDDNVLVSSALLAPISVLLLEVTGRNLSPKDFCAPFANRILKSFCVDMGNC